MLKVDDVIVFLFENCLKNNLLKRFILIWNSWIWILFKCIYYDVL